MNGWGKVPGILALGLVVMAACGGRTNALEGEYEDGGDTAGSGVGGANGGSKPQAGSSNRGGASNRGGTSGRAGNSQGGVYIGGAYTGGYAGDIYVAGAGPIGGSYAGTFGFGGATGIAGSFPVAGFANGGFAGTGLDCATCLRNACSGQLVQCLTDFGCISIFSCMQQTGCQGFNCYSPNTCAKVIDMNGGPGGPAMNHLLQVVACGVTSNCSCN